ncbi:hypothetical protein DFH11DRAFT_859220 [Phellopilus nigrolimitatus]|nr:hypothetical protein DFH11DRAFT_859220 [Phellopilus nigrolimitatus]
MDQRPSTSKARGVCKYFSRRRGCLNGDTCKFLHGEGETLSPYDKSKTCRFFTAGFCKHGDKCWFHHAGSTSGPAAFEIGTSSTAVPLAQEAEDEEESLCCICQDKPVTYGLLEGCSHICCLECLRGWRDPSGKSHDIVASGNTKKCPYCRTPSNFITPSSVFYPGGDPRKTETIAQYKASMARVPCKYFERSESGRRHCPFGIDCFYEHKERDGNAFVFSHGAGFYMNRMRNHVRSRNELFPNTFPFLRTIRTENDVLQTLSELRSRLESLHLIPRANLNSSDNENAEENFLSRLVDEVLTSLEDAIGGSGPASTEDEYVEERHSTSSRPSILAAPEYAQALSFNSDTSPLPLTRAFMDSNILTDEREETAGVPVLEQPSVSTFSAPRPPDPWSSAWTDGDEDDEDARSETIDNVIDPFSQDGESPPPLEGYVSARLPSRFLNNADQSLPTTVGSDVESGSDDDVPSGEPSGQRPLERSLILPERGDADEAPGRQSTTTGSGGGNQELQDRESQSKAETRKETPRRSKSYSGVSFSGQSQGRRNGNGSQSFVTDGRGRVVATDDGAPADATSLASWTAGAPVIPPTPHESSASAGSEFPISE